MKNLIFTLFLLFLTFTLINCDLFKPADDDFFKKIDEEITYANAPWVPLFIQTGGMGIADPTGPQAKLAKKAPLVESLKMKYSFSLYFQPSREYPFIGWQAWVEGEGIWAQWSLNEKWGEERVKFVPQNEDGTIVEIFVYEIPPDRKQLYIGPLGADTLSLKVYVETGNLGTAFPTGELPGIMQGYPFNISFQPDTAYEFRGWQALFSEQSAEMSIVKWEPGEGEVEKGGIQWSPRNASGTEMTVTVQDFPEGFSNNCQIVIMPLDGDSSPVEVRVLANPDWGTNFSAPLLIRRVGFPFTVEFAASGAWDFLGWRAYAYDGQSAETLTPEALGEELPAKDIVIEVTGIGKATVTVNTNKTVLLVPLCVRPVRVDYSNPPNGSPTAYAPGQSITITFSTQLDEDTVKFGEGFIQITGQSGAAPVNISACYTLAYNDAAHTVTVTPDPAQLLTTDTAVTVMVDTGVKGKHGNSLNAPAHISFNVSVDGGVTVKNVYTAARVYALHNTAQYESGFYQSENLERDRRIRRNTGDPGSPYELTLYFGVQASNTDMDNTIDHDFTIAEIHYAHLTGTEVKEALGQPVTDGKGVYEISELEITGAELLYRQANPNAGKYYKAVYRWTAPVQGILRLVVLPFSGEDVPSESWETVIASGQGYITVAFDNLAPGGSETAGFGGSATQSVEGGAIVYNYNESQSEMTVNLNFRNIRDNYDEGTGAVNGNLNVSGNRPRTMDPQSAVEWQWQIVTGEADNPTGEWLSLVNSVSGDAVGVISEDLSERLDSDIAVREVQVRYRDSLGWTSDWNTVGRIRYYNAPALGTNGTWTAVYNGANTINLTWEMPDNATRTEVLIDGVSVYDGTGTSYTISGVPSFSTANPTGSGSRVRAGYASDVRGYAVSLRSYNTYYNGSAVEFNVYNSFPPNTNFTNANTVFIRQDSIPANFTAADIVNYVLTDNITLTNWTPQNISSRNFYGNGYTITINGIAGSSNMGLFSTMSDGNVHDLTVNYTTSTDGVVDISRSSVTNFGGIAGTANGSAQFINVLVKGAVNITLTGNFTFRVGGMAGLMSNAATIANAYGGLALTVDKQDTANNYVFTGGIVGDTAEGGTSARRAINGATVAANINHTQTAGPIYVGGAAGRTQATLTFHDIEFSGSLTAIKSDAYTGDSYIGGITGYVNNGNYSECKVPGTIIIPRFPGSGDLHIGGIWGYYNVESSTATEASDCWSRGNISFIGGSVDKYVGGVLGYSAAANGSSIKMTNCRYEEGAIIVNAPNTKYVGGFCGRIGSNTTLTGCYTNASLVSVTGNSYIYAGGFAGNMDGATLSNCYSLSDVYANGTGGRVIAGGFASSIWNSPSTLSACYAAGDVSIVGTGDVTTNNTFGFSAGGFLGAGATGSTGSNINNCYALGAVTAEKPGGDGTVNAGGIVGYFTGSSINNCFFGGTVTAIRNTGGDYTQIYAGGIAGRYGSITNSAAIGASVTAMGGGAASSNVGRIWGSAGTGSGNYAFTGMQLLTAASPTGIATVVPSASTVDTSPNGKDAFIQFFDQIFWRNLPVDSVLGFDTNTWDFSTVNERGYPVLRGLNGQGNWSKWWDFILQPGSVSINNNNLSQTVAVVGWPTGAVTLNNTSALPTGVSVGVAGTTITVTGVRPQLGSDPITGDFTIGVTFGGVTKNLSISVHLTDDPIFVSIGTGNTSTREMPFNFYDRQSWVQTMYYKDEIGQPSGSEIIEISYFNSFASTITRRVRVYMANTSNTNVNSWLAASNFTSTLVFDGEIRFPTGQNEISIELDTPFVYNGGNLVILTHRLYTTYTTGENFIQTTGSVANRSRYYSDDGPSTDSVIVPSDPGTGSDAFPNIRLKIVVNN